MRSLRLKILAVAAALVLLSQAGTVATVLVTANRDVAERARLRLETGSRTFEQLSHGRAMQLGNTVDVLAADYAFRQAVATRDLATITSALANHARRAKADIAFLFDESGTVVAATDAATAAVQPALVEQSLERSLVRSTIVRDGRAYEMLTVAVRAPLPIAWVSMGFVIDDAYLRRLEDLTGLHATVFARSHGAALPVASTLDAPLREAMVTASAGLAAGLTRTLEVAGERQLVISRPFIAESPDVTVLLTESLDEAMAPYRLLQTAAVVLGMLPLLLALTGAVLLSRSLTRPVSQLADAAQRMKRGDYSVPVPVDSGDELGELAVTFNSMQDDIARREARITYQARHDSLTGLPNRDFALEQLEQQIREAAAGQRFTVMVLDLNALGEIAASLGHDIADTYVQHAAEQLRAQIEPRNVLARLESDSFLLVMPEAGAEDAEDLAHRLLQRLESGIGLQNLNVSVRPAIGIAVYPEHGTNHDQLLLRATVAQSDSRHAVRPVGLYHGGGEERRVRRLTILGDLRRAVRHEELRLFYQPKVALADGAVCGVEALVRWDHPKLGRLSPAEFIPIAEQSGNISILTRWALTAAARECRLWLEEGLDLTVSVNLSAHDLLDKDLPWFVLETLRNHDLSPRHLVAEITEEGVVRDFANATVLLQRLRELGIRISIDDFGTGYSSLAQLRNLPVDELKIDRSFVLQLPDNRADAAIVSATIDLAHNLGLEFVAEGVESGTAMRWLRERGCERAQGFFVSPPLPAEEFVAWLRRYSGGATQRGPALQSA
jgi:diguanylate cyclase (GGDEF)-like protein